MPADIRREHPRGPFDLVLCRNLVCTYFDVAMQAEVLRSVTAAMNPGGILVVGRHEAAPAQAAGLAPLDGSTGFYRRATG